jgi:hypothetical protein
MFGAGQFGPGTIFGPPLKPSVGYVQQKAFASALSGGYDQPNGLGDLGIAVVYVSQGTFPTGIQDNNRNTWCLVLGTAIPSGVGGLAFYVCTYLAAGANSITLLGAGLNPAYINFVILEYSYSSPLGMYCLISSFDGGADSAAGINAYFAGTAAFNATLVAAASSTANSGLTLTAGNLRSSITSPGTLAVADIQSSGSPLTIRWTVSSGFQQSLGLVFCGG